MELEGFIKNIVDDVDGDTVIEYRLKDGPSWKYLQAQIDKEGSIVIYLLENGEVPKLSLGERASSPINNKDILSRLLNAMAVHHFNAYWIEDCYTTIDVEMISRGFEIGQYTTGEMIWFKPSNNTVIIVRRENSNNLLSSSSDGAILLVKWPAGTELKATAFDTKSLLSFIDDNTHFKLYNPHSNVEIECIHIEQGQTVH